MLWGRDTNDRAFDLFGEDASEFANHIGLEGGEKTQFVRERHHPSSQGEIGQDAIREVRSEIGHSSGSAAGAKASLVAKKRDENIVSAIVAMTKGEARGEVSATELGLEGFGDVPWQRAIIVRLDVREKACVVLLDLTHGAELFFSERVGLSDEEIARRVCAKTELAAFSEPELSDRPDYSSKEILGDVQKLLRRGSGQNDPKN